MKIGELAQLTHLSVDAIRFYERKGVLAPPARRASGYRDYSPNIVDRLKFAKELQQLGFTLQEIGDVLGDLDRGVADCRSEKHRFEAVLLRIDQKLVDLRNVRRRLAQTLERCAAGECRLTAGPRQR